MHLHATDSDSSLAFVITQSSISLPTPLKFMSLANSPINKLGMYGCAVKELMAW
jgi:hypothetical protein